MKKFALCCLVLALAVMVVPQSQAATYCVSLSSFCDTFNLTSANVGGIQGVLLYGAWDWECLGDYSSASIVGTPPAGKTYLATRPVYSGTDYAFAYTAMWSLKAAGSVADLYGATATSEFPFQLSTGWSYSSGACRAHRTSMPRATK